MRLRNEVTDSRGKEKEQKDVVVFFEKDILVQMMRALSVGKVNGFSLELTAMSISPGCMIGKNFSMKCVLPIVCPETLNLKKL